MEKINDLENSQEKNKKSFFEKIKESRKFFLLGLSALALEQGIENFDSEKFEDAVNLGTAATINVLNLPLEQINDDLYKNFGVEEEPSGDIYEVKIEPNTLSLNQITLKDLKEEFALDSSKEDVSYIGFAFSALKARHLARLNNLSTGELGIHEKINKNSFYNDNYYKENLRKPTFDNKVWKRSAFIQNKK